MMIKEIKKCIGSLLIHRLRTLLSTLGILFGVAAVIAMLSIGEGAKQETLAQIEQLGMNHIIVRRPASSGDQSHAGLTEADVEALSKNIPSLLDYAPLKVIEANLTGPLADLTPEILAVTRTYGSMKGLHLAEGRFICDYDQQGKRMVCVLGYEAAKSLGKNGHAGYSIRLGKSHFEIVGILSPTNWKPSKNVAITARNLDQTVFIPLGSESSLLRSSQPEKTLLSEIILQVENAGQMKLTVPLVKKILARLHGSIEDYQIIVPLELLQQAYRTQRMFNLVLGSIAAISLIVGGIGIMNIMLATVSERTREIGVRRAMGANRGHILKQFLLETVLLSLAGAFLGVLLGIIGSAAISYLAGWKTIVTVWSVVVSLMMSSVVGICSGMYPAYKAAVMDPIRALRHEA